jgi:tetraacyldisaccharide-1-P 4'-kinase
MSDLERRILKFLENSKKNNSGEKNSASERRTLNLMNLIKNILKLPLLLISYIVIIFTKIKRFMYANNILLRSKDSGIFTVSIGNINMGGSGKTPLVYSLASYLYNEGFKPCIVSRGYGANLKKKSILPDGNMTINICFPMKPSF